MIDTTQPQQLFNCLAKQGVYFPPSQYTMIIQEPAILAGIHPLRARRRTRFMWLCLALTLTVVGCRTAPVYTAPKGPLQEACLMPTSTQDLLIGLAVSGGGSRAALFAAGVYKALAQIQVGPENRSLLEQVSYISSVSGGSLASAYYTLKKPAGEIPILTQAGGLTEPYQQFFEGFRESMAQDLEGPLLRRQLFQWRWFNPAWTAKSLHEILSSDEFLGPVTFGELARREARGDSPRLLVNTTLYNDGRRLVVSTLPRAESRFDLMASVGVSGDALRGSRHADVLQARWESLQSESLQDLKIDVCRSQVSTAVVASMSFPPLIGPITLHVEGEDQYWHIGDGGMSDNTGGESLLMVALKKLHEGTARRALLLVIDSSFPFAVGGKSLNHRKEGFSLFDYDYSRIASIPEERSLTYRSLFLGIGQLQGVLPDPSRIGIIRLGHTDAQWKNDLSGLPDSCKKEQLGWKTPPQVRRHLAGIVTRLWLEKTCDRDLILRAAEKVVAQNEEAIRKFLESKPSNIMTPDKSGVNP